jgi:hypothetical protein
MKLALTKFKHYPSLSEETTAYEAVITVDGVPAFHASNRGKGEADLFRPLEPFDKTRPLLRAAEAYAKTLPPLPARDGLPELPMNLELLIGELIDDKLLAADLTKALKKKALFIKDGKVMETYKGGVALSVLIAHVEAKYPGLPLLNKLPFEDALKLYSDPSVLRYAKDLKVGDTLHRFGIAVEIIDITPRVHPEMNKDVISVTHRNPADHTATATVDYFPNSITL